MGSAEPGTRRLSTVSACKRSPPHPVAMRHSRQRMARYYKECHLLHRPDPQRRWFLNQTATKLPRRFNVEFGGYSQPESKRNQTGSTRWISRSLTRPPCTRSSTLIYALNRFRASRGGLWRGLVYVRRFVPARKSTTRRQCYFGAAGRAGHTKCATLQIDDGPGAHQRQLRLCALGGGGAR